jgi:cytochrome c-type biogenesis protein CcmF
VEDIYLTLVRTPANEGEPAAISVIVQPLVVWLWIGGALMALGSILAVVRQRPARENPTPAKDEDPKDEVVAK